MFEIGQQVVCIKTHPNKVVKEGETYTIKSMSIHCKCGLSVDIGAKDPCGPDHIICCCQDCDMTYALTDIWWISHKRFVPLDQWEQAEEAKESLLEELKVKI